MFQLHLLRAIWSWAAIGCFVGSIFLGTEMLQQRHPARAAFFYVFGIALSLVFGLMLNWFFGLAPLFCIREQASARNALSLTLDFCARQGGRLFGLSLGFLALRLVWAGSMFLLILAPTNLSKHLAVGWILLMMGFFFVIYLAGADALYLARLGAYTTLAEIDTQPEPEPVPNPSPEPAAPVYPIEGTPDIQPA
jgi:tetrahydromethanopterin S-methyltransferase subunit E